MHTLAVANYENLLAAHILAIAQLLESAWTSSTNDYAATSVPKLMWANMASTGPISLNNFVDYLFIELKIKIDF